MIFVTGATGHIGNVLIRHLLNAGRTVRALVLPTEDTHPLDGLPVEIVEGDVLDAKSLLTALNGVESVFHLAGIISIMPGKNEMLRSVNILGTRNILWACQEANIKRLVYTSSIHALQRAPTGVTIDERIPFDIEHAISDYDRSKAQASLEVIQAVKQGLNAVIVCPTGVIGPFDYLGSELGHLIQDCIQKKPQLYVDGAYDFVDVRDVADGLFLASERGKPGETYILSGEKWSVRRLIDTVRDLSGLHFPRIRVPMAIALFVSRFSPLFYQLACQKPRITPYSLQTLVSNSDISHAKAESELDYHPRPLINSIRDTITWFLDNHVSYKTL